MGFGMDPDLQMDIITELDLVNTTLGVTQVSGLHNASKAFLFQGKGSPSFAWGQSLGRRVSLGSVRLACTCRRIVSTISLVLWSGAMFSNAEGVHKFRGCSEAVKGARW